MWNLSVRAKLLSISILSSSAALLAAGVLFLWYDLTAYRRTTISDIETQTELLAFSNIPALQFDDVSVIQRNLELLRYRPSIFSAAIYDEGGTLLSSYSRDMQSAVPSQPPEQGLSSDATMITSVQPISENGIEYGTVYITSDYRLDARASKFAQVLAAVFIAAVAIAVLVSRLTQAYITRPLLSIVAVAHEVTEKRKYDQRAEKVGNDEVGKLVDAFNLMLAEIGGRTADIERRTQELEKTNLDLEREIEARNLARLEVLDLNTRLKEKMDELRDADQRKDDFLATLAHELRNPLAPIRTGIELLLDPSSSPEARVDILKILERQSNHIARLVDDLMDISRITRGKVNVIHEKVLINTVLKSALEAQSSLVEKRGHVLDISLPEQPVYVLGDADRLTQVISNLISNAANYTPPGGRLTVVVESGVDSESVKIIVNDNGIGIAQEYTQSVFEPFIQIESSLTRQKTGLGLGLALSRSIIEMHNGTIRCESAGVGLGTTVIVELPVLDVTASPVTNTKPAPEAKTCITRILVVDDNKDAANTLSVLLSLIGYTVETAYSGQSALAEGEKFLPELIFMDIGMPGMDGNETAALIRQSSWGATTALVALTGWGHENDRQKTTASGFDLHLLKPVSVADIEEAIAHLSSREAITAERRNVRA